MNGSKFCFVKRRKISSVYDTAFFYCDNRNHISLGIHGLDTVKFFITDITKKNRDFNIIHLSGNLGNSKLHRQSIRVVSVFRMKICGGVPIL